MPEQSVLMHECQWMFSLYICSPRYAPDPFTGALKDLMFACTPAIQNALDEARRLREPAEMEKGPWLGSSEMMRTAV